MPINKEYGIIFVHIPKNAGTNMEAFFKMTKPRLLYGVNNIKEDGITFSPQHLTPPLIKDRLGDEVYEKYFKFCFVRNPYERVISEFFWQRAHGIITKLTEGLDKNVDFKTWFFSFYNKIDSDHKLPQHCYVYDADGNSMVDFMGRVENIDKDFPEVLKRINYTGTGKLKSARKNSKSHDFSMIDSEIKEKIIDIYKKDFEYFGYKK